MLWASPGGRYCPISEPNALTFDKRKGVLLHGSYVLCILPPTEAVSTGWKEGEEDEGQGPLQTYCVLSSDLDALPVSAP